MTESRERAKRIIANNLYLILATSHDDQPWSTPVFFASDQQTFYWYSQKTTRHSQNILHNPQVAASIFGVGNDDEDLGFILKAKRLKLRKMTYNML